MSNQETTPETLNPETGTAYSRRQLQTVFDQVCALNWKDPIHYLLPVTADLEMVRTAIIFYTGSVPTFSGGRYGITVRAAGYYAAVGA